MVRPAKYIKSFLLNQILSIKCLQYIFFLLLQKKMQGLNRSIYTFLKTTKGQRMLAGAFLSNMNKSDENLEANMLQPISGMKQFLYRKQSKLKCSSTTLFLTCSCAEYHSPDVSKYLHMVNDVSDSYNIKRLCTEDPISVSRQFSNKLHDFFKQLIIKPSY